MTETHQPKLCEVCAQIDLEPIFERSDKYFAERTSLTDLGHHRDKLSRLASEPFIDAHEIVWRNERGSREATVCVASLSGKTMSSNQFVFDCQLCKLFMSRGYTNDDFELTACSSLRCSRFVLAERLETPVELRVDRGYLALLNITRNSFAKDFYHRDLTRQTGIFRVSETARGHPLSTPDGGIWGRIVPHWIDYKLPKAWISFCFHNHVTVCKRPSSDVHLAGFQVIDCSHDPPKIERHSMQVEYVALSYVWNSSPDPPGAMTEVILDAIEATRRLGFRYLWVDRFCVNEQNQREKLHVIANMDRIYQHAELTIVAACDTYNGLPGVHRPDAYVPRGRGTPVKFTKGNLTLAPCLPDPAEAIRKSAWSSRGWTFQESLLSRRLLVFTSQQLYWNCCGMTAQESVIVPPELSHLPDMSRSGGWAPPGMFDRVDSAMPARPTTPLRSISRVMKDIGSSVFKYTQPYPTPASVASPHDNPTVLTQPLAKALREIVADISTYSRRQLTYDSDSLLAFQGNHADFILGLPMTNQAFQNSRVTFAVALSDWTHDEIRPTLGYPCWRRRHLPSWTWTGWGGTVLDSSFKRTIDVIEHSHLDIRAASSEDYSPMLSLCARECKSEWDTTEPELVISDVLPVIDEDRWNSSLRVKQPFIVNAAMVSHCGGNVLRISQNLYTLRLSVTCVEHPGSPATFQNEAIQELREGKTRAVLIWSGRNASSLLLLKLNGERRDGKALWERIGVLHSMIMKSNPSPKRFSTDKGFYQSSVDYLIA
ncbi:heterokaryon incompatibility protein-domain-containing protein [Xylariales sp. AK1849]|nr:heterokaryon incompatibility protein-domain-containing protein [Xylariales sp. AK1849]